MRSEPEHPEPRKAPRESPADQRDEGIGYRNVDEEAEHDERGSQGPRPEENPPREQ